ncbi:bifunctional purple acid phosphatase 26-like protein [Tanacetum coccineum]
MFDRAFKRVNTFEDFRTELVEGKEKRAGTELIQEITKKQKLEDDIETTELKLLKKIIPDEEEVAIDAILLVVKSPMIVDWKIYKEGRKSYYQIIRANGKSQMKLNQEKLLMEHGHQDYGVNIITSSDFLDSKIYTTISVYITVGDGGNQEGLALRFNDPQPDYSAFREANYGHSTLEIMNKTHAFYHWNRNDDGKKVAADAFVLHNQYWNKSLRRRKLKKNYLHTIAPTLELNNF